MAGSTGDVPRRALRIGLVLSRVRQPAWLCKVVADLASSTIAEIALVIVGPSARRRRPRAWDLAGWRAYHVFDEHFFPVQPDAQTVASIETAITSVPAVHVRALSSAEITSRVRESALDALLLLDSVVLPRDALLAPAYGAWSFVRDPGVLTVDEVGVPEVVRGVPFTTTSLYRLDQGQSQVLVASTGPTLPLSAGRNHNRSLWRLSELPMRAVRAVYDGQPPQVLTHAADGLLSEENGLLLRRPPNLVDLVELGSRLVARAARGAAQRISSKLARESTWSLGLGAYAPGSGKSGSTARFAPLVAPKDRFWADPCVVQDGGAAFIFVEEYLFKEHRGRIAVLETHDRRLTSPSVPVIERQSHLSYPFVFTWNDAYHMVFESSADETVELYRCRRFPDRWELVKVLMSGVRALDVTLTEFGGRWWLFTTLEIPGQATNDELHLFFADSPLGPWHPHPRNPVKSDVRSARPAGRVFASGQHLYRPAQDCSVRYGYALSFNRIEELSETAYQEVEIERLVPSRRSGILAVHTFNRAEDLAVVDVMTRKWKWTTAHFDSGAVEIPVLRPSS